MFFCSSVEKTKHSQTKTATPTEKQPTSHISGSPHRGGDVRTDRGGLWGLNFMSIKIKAIERNVAFEKGTEKWAFVMQPELYSRLNEQKVVQEAALRSGIGKGAISAAWEAIGDVIRAWATEGHSVAVPGLGTMRFGVRSNSVEKVEDVNSTLITSRRVIFTPSTEIKQELAKTAISITCYDRNGNVIKQVTSDDDGNVDNGEEPDPTPSNPTPSDPDTGGEDDDDEGGLAG